MNPIPPADRPPCDLVMKGGITSGVVYPGLIARLADEYRFRSVGGTSAGAIAAAGCAAAEFGRQSGRNAGAMADLARLPQQLGSPAVAGREGSMLFHLFRPAPWLADHFAVLVGALNKQNTIGRIVGAVSAMLLKFWGVVLLAVLVMALVGVPALQALSGLGTGAAAGVLLACLVLCVVVWVVVARLPGGTLPRVLLALAASVALNAALVAGVGRVGLGAALVMSTAAVSLWIVLTGLVAIGLAAARFVMTMLSGLQRNFWGLCSGHADDEAARPQALTDWLTGFFDGLAGVAATPRPLTFGDLWGEPADAPIVASAPDRPARTREIDLQVMTTAVSQQMCYAIPLRDNAGQYYYDRAEWERLFPTRVMQWLDAVSAVEDAGHPPVHGARGQLLRRLPPNRYLPVVVAVRMSLSFPVLLSAVPLYAHDFSLRKEGQPVPPPKRVWFSDGGISSNMPLHFFDAPLPGRPTFAIGLKGEHPVYPIDPAKKASEQEGRVYLPESNRQGLGQYWAPPADDTPVGLFDFLGKVVDTMQNWRDQIVFPYPGYRDRIVQISQRPDEGGLNLNMERRHIDALADAGEFAAERLIQRFAQGDGWPNHKQIRLRTFSALVEELLRHPRLQDPAWDDVVRQVAADGQYNATQRDLTLHVLAALRGLGQEMEASGDSIVPRAPKPRPEMRVSPRI